MKLEGRLKEEFEEWAREHFNIQVLSGVYLHDYLDDFPLSMQFALLCDFLEENRCIIVLNKAAMCYECEIMIGYRSTYFLDRSTKTEAIEKAIEYLNDNY